jgi:hypothetical protein
MILSLSWIVLTGAEDVDAIVRESGALDDTRTGDEQYKSHYAVL